MRVATPEEQAAFKKTSPTVVAEEAERHPGAVIETFATDEHRIGLKPILRRVWAPRGERPIAPCHHRFEWLYVTAFVSPATGESFWYLGTGVDKELFEDTLALFAREAGAGRDRIIILVLDGAGWHTAPGLAVPEGIRLVYLPPYTPELQPAETLWVHVDEPIVNKHFETLGRPRRRRRRAVRRPQPGSQPGPRSGGLPLVARPRLSDLISRSWYQEICARWSGSCALGSGDCPEDIHAGWRSWWSVKRPPTDAVFAALVGG